MSTHPDLVLQAIETFKYHPSILKIKEFMTDILQAIETFKYHPSILKIKEFMTDKGITFSFNYTTQEKT